MRSVTSLIVVLSAVVWSQAATAAVMTFKDLPPFGLSTGTYVEDGITASAFGDFGFFGTPETAHLDDSGTSLPQTINFAMAGSFDAVSFDILPFATAYCANPASCIGGDPYDNILLEGFRDGFLVAVDRIFMGTQPSTYALGSQFANLDGLSISAVFPDFAAIGGICFDAPCGHFNIDNVRLSPVPLPAALPLLAGALGLLGLFGWRRKKTAAA